MEEKKYLDPIGLEHLKKKLVEEFDDGITEDVINKAWDSIVGNPGVLESSTVISSEEPTELSDNMIWIG